VTEVPSELRAAVAPRLSGDEATNAVELLCTRGVAGSSVLCASSARRSIPGDERVLVLSLRALRPIAADEALSIGYYQARVRTVLRQAHLRNQYGFECRCTLCEGRDETRAFLCCFPAVHSDLPAGSTSGQDELSAGAAATVAAVAAARCLGTIAPLRLGNSACDFRCDTCARELDDPQRVEALEWERRLRAEGAAEALVTARAAAHGPSAHWPLMPHPSHYLCPRR